MNDWGEWIKNKRECSDMSQTELARALGKTGRTFVHYVENGVIPSVENLELLAKVLNVPLEDMLLAAGRIPDDLQKGVRRNMAEVKKFLRRMQKV